MIRIIAQIAVTRPMGWGCFLGVGLVVFGCFAVFFVVFAMVRYSIYGLFWLYGIRNRMDVNC